MADMNLIGLEGEAPPQVSVQSQVMSRFAPEDLARVKAHEKRQLKRRMQKYRLSPLLKMVTYPFVDQDNMNERLEPIGRTKYQAPMPVNYVYGEPAPRDPMTAQECRTRTPCRGLFVRARCKFSAPERCSAHAVRLRGARLPTADAQDLMIKQFDEVSPKGVVRPTAGNKGSDFVKMNRRAIHDNVCDPKVLKQWRKNHNVPLKFSKATTTSHHYLQIRTKFHDQQNLVNKHLSLGGGQQAQAYAGLSSDKINRRVQKSELKASGIIDTGDWEGQEARLIEKGIQNKLMRMNHRKALRDRVSPKRHIASLQSKRQTEMVCSPHDGWSGSVPLGRAEAVNNFHIDRFASVPSRLKQAQATENPEYCAARPWSVHGRPSLLRNQLRSSTPLPIPTHEQIDLEQAAPPSRASSRPKLPPVDRPSTSGAAQRPAQDAEASMLPGLRPHTSASASSRSQGGAQNTAGSLPPAIGTVDSLLPSADDIV
eukprot:gene8543-1528_t